MFQHVRILLALCNMVMSEVSHNIVLSQRILFAFLQGLSTPPVQRWPLDQAQPTASLTSQATNFLPATPSRIQPGALHSPCTCSSPASSSAAHCPPECEEGERHTENAPLPTSSGSGDQGVSAEDGGVSCREKSFSAYTDAPEHFVPGQTEQETLDDEARAFNHQNPKGVVDGSESSGTCTGALNIVCALLEAHGNINGTAPSSG